MSPGRFALIVTSDTYADPRLSSLRAPTADAEELGRVLRDPDIGEFDVAISHNEPEHVVRRRLSAFFEKRGMDDLLVLHMSCHGVKDEDGRLYFATEDTEVDHLDATAIPADFVNRQMTRCRSRRIVLLLDCCYSGAFARGMVGRGGDRMDIKERFEGRGRIVLTASSAMEYSFEGDHTSGQGRPSVFTSAIVDGLSTGAADRDRDGFVTVDELYDFAFEQVRTVTPSQTPGKWVFDVQGDVHLARSAAGVPPSLPTELETAMVSPFAQVRRGAVEELATLSRNPDKRLAAAALEALVELTQDDSKEVSRAARQHVGIAEEGAPEIVVPPQRIRAEAPQPDPLAPGLQKDAAAFEQSAPHPTMPSRVPWACRVAAVALLGPATGPFLSTETTTQWRMLAVLGPLVAIAAAGLLCLISGGFRWGRIRSKTGVLIAVGALLTAGSSGLIVFTVEWVGAAGVVVSVLGLLGALLAGVTGLVLLRRRSTASPTEPPLAPPLALGLSGIAFVIGSVFVTYDGSTSLWTAVEENPDSIPFACIPFAAILAMAGGVLLLRSQRLLASGILGATGILSAIHSVGVLLAATYAEGGVGPAWVLGVAGGVLAAVAGWRAAPDQARSVDEFSTPLRS